jgi:hypothetical protein
MYYINQMNLNSFDDRVIKNVCMDVNGVLQITKELSNGVVSRNAHWHDASKELVKFTT